MDYTIEGQIAQAVRIDVPPGSAIWASAGSLMSHTSGVRWDLKMPGGVEGVTKRLLSGEGVSLLYIEADQPNQQVMLSASRPGHVMEWDLADGPVTTTRGAFVAAAGEQIDIDVTVARRAGAMLFGGAGLFLQRISGKGKVLVHGRGDFIDKRLVEGESITVSSGNLAAFSDGVDYDIRSTGDVKRWLFSGEGLFMTQLTGPGRVLLQTLRRTAAHG
jgi:uncharacterized protein (TIGR00266 family)